MDYKKKYIDAEKLKAEINGKIAEIEKEPAPADRETTLLQMCKINAFREVLSVINRIEKNTLLQEQPEVDLERDAVEFCFDKGFNLTPYQVKTIARHFYELGKNSKL